MPIKSSRLTHEGGQGRDSQLIFTGILNPQIEIIERPLSWITTVSISQSRLFLTAPKV